PFAGPFRRSQPPAVRQVGRQRQYARAVELVDHGLKIGLSIPRFKSLGFGGWDRAPGSDAHVIGRGRCGGGPLWPAWRYGRAALAVTAGSNYPVAPAGWVGSALSGRAVWLTGRDGTGETMHHPKLIAAASVLALAVVGAPALAQAAPVSATLASAAVM